MTPKEFEAAYRGHLRANGFDPDALNDASNLREQMNSLLREYSDDDK